MSEKVWNSLWRGFNPDDFAESPYMLKFYELLLSDSDFRGKRILEIGCGTGINSIFMAKRGARVTLLDSSREALRIARKIMEMFSVEAEVIHGDIFDYDLKGYDIVHSEGVVEHFLGKKRQKIIDIHTRAVKRGGKVVIIVPNMKSPPYRIGKFLAEITGTWVHGKEYPFSRRELVERMRRSGLSIERELGGEFLLSFGWLFAPLWLKKYSRLLSKGFSFSSNGGFFKANYGNPFANRWGRAIGVTGVKK